jgi:hypothetical protein
MGGGIAVPLGLAIPIPMGAQNKPAIPTKMNPIMVKTSTTLRLLLFGILGAINPTPNPRHTPSTTQRAPH